MAVSMLYNIPRIVSFKWYTLSDPRVYKICGFPTGVKGLIHNKQNKAVLYVTEKITSLNFNL